MYGEDGREKRRGREAVIAAVIAVAAAGLSRRETGEHGERTAAIRAENITGDPVDIDGTPMDLLLVTDEVTGRGLTGEKRMAIVTRMTTD